MNFELTLEDYTIILNALHYYKKVDKVGSFKQYDEKRINDLRDKLANQLVPSEFSFDEYEKVVNKEK
jgi:hypothetical protein